jgi:tRNA (guanine-N7-)-methyltransferase
MNEHVTPARPHQRFTEDGRRVREVLTYARRGSRFTNKQQLAWDTYAERYWIPDEQVDQPGFAFADVFPAELPLVVEIGCGIGEATAALAAARPDHNVLGFEVWRPGVAECVGRFGELGLDNVRICSVDAVWCVGNLFGEEQLAELWSFFPDPWHKKRHHKRRLVNPGFAHLAATRLVTGGVWRLATDWGDYAEQAVEVLGAEPLLVGGVVDRWADRPLTRFERRGIKDGREITDLAFRRV